MVDGIEVVVRLTCLLSVLASLYLLIRVLRRPSKTMLAKQILNLAVADIAAFGWEMAAPNMPCVVHENVFKSLFLVSTLTEYAIAIGMLMTLMRSRMLPYGATLTLLVWPGGALQFCVWYFTPIGSSAFDTDARFCIGTKVQVVLELVSSAITFLVICFIYLLTFCVAERWSPSSVVTANVRYARSFLLGYCLAVVPYWIFLFHVQEALYGRASLNRIYYLFGHVFLCSNGIVNALVYSVHRLRGRGNNDLASFAVAFEEDDEVVGIEDVSAEALHTAEFDVRSLESSRASLRAGESEVGGSVHRDGAGPQLSQERERVSLS